jgi:hypothetical protein
LSNTTSAAAADAAAAALTPAARARRLCMPARLRRPRRSSPEAKRNLTAFSAADASAKRAAGALATACWLLAAAPNIREGGAGSKQRRLGQ